jgi:hypothetical protein
VEAPNYGDVPGPARCLRPRGGGQVLSRLDLDGASRPFYVTLVEDVGELPAGRRLFIDPDRGWGEAGYPWHLFALPDGRAIVRKVRVRENLAQWVEPEREGAGEPPRIEVWNLDHLDLLGVVVFQGGKPPP